MADFIAGFGGIGGAVQDLFGAKGHQIAAGGYDRAAGYADNAAALAEVSGNLKERQIAREAYKIIGGQQADIAAAGFRNSGSALDIIRSSTQEAGLALGIQRANTEIEKNDFIAQADAYRTQAANERNAGVGDFFGGLLKAGAAVAAFFI